MIGIPACFEKGPTHGLLSKAFVNKWAISGNRCVITSYTSSSYTVSYFILRWDSQ